MVCSVQLSYCRDFCTSVGAAAQAIVGDASGGGAWQMGVHRNEMEIREAALGLRSGWAEIRLREPTGEARTWKTWGYKVMRPLPIFGPWSGNFATS